MDKSHIYDISKLTDDETITLIKQIVNDHPGCGATRILKASPNKQLQDAIMRLTSFLDVDEMSFVNLQTRTYMLINGMTSIDQFPHCEHCKKIIRQNVISVHVGFPYNTCSASCAALNPARKKKIEATNMKNHGNPKWNNGEKISVSLKNMDPEKRKETTQKFKRTRQKHIDENPNYWNDRLQKTRKTKLEKHGNENWQNGKQISETKRRRAAENPSYYQDALKKSKQTKFEKYGDENFSNPEQTKQTKFERYGDPAYTNREQSAQTCMERYGVDNGAKTEQAKQKAKNTCIDRYGVESYSQTELFLEQSQHTCMERYGVPYFSQSEAGRKMLSIRNNTNYYNNVICAPESEVEPLFTVDEYCQKTPLTQFKWRCKKCGNVFVSQLTIAWANNYDDGQVARCLNCHPLNLGKSEKRREVIKYVNSLTHDGFKAEDRKHIHPYEIDMLNESLMLGIEFDGMYWHCNFSGTSDTQMISKTNLCNKNGITLIHIFEDEWDKRKAQCKAKLKQMLAAQDDIDFSGTHIEQIQHSVAKQFLLKNSHNIFAKPSRYNYGMFSDDGKLMSCMTVSYFCNKVLITNICNSIAICTTKTYNIFIEFLKNTFVLDHPALSIQMNIDNRWPEDKLMNNLNFTKTKQTSTSCWLIDINEGWHRKCKGIGPNILQQYGSYDDHNRQKFMADNKLTYIVDCGQTVYEMKL